ncbi:PAS domain-containing sensor histidine kinase [Flavobacterium sp. MFBS3-15]|uniref:PAS domain-containing sensor histidine kinase n=1 Tax=Flavobacterium sp. MFBS3-15 TaxID=2989816 RepID=UPI002235BB8D|nr:PAS domain-containing sensor histidine kinase [Flavobacterium sp. MFBS3-15]MCW4469668.1 PAS domain-containing sensor histidine kinase [Flavobacterium sp. MFBS3-15]
MKNEALLNSIVENAIDGIITINDRGIVESINPAACQLFLYSPEEVVGRNISMLMPPPDKERHDDYIERYRHTGQAHIIGYGRDVIGLKKDGSVFPFRLGVSEVKYEGERMFAGFIHDLSHQKEAENRLMEYTQHLEDVVKERTTSLNETIEELTKAKEEVSLSLEKEKELGKLKSRLLSMASHEFRTPLSSIQLSASLIERYTAQLENANVEKHLYKIKGAVNNLTTILNDFLHVEKAEAGKVEVKWGSFDIEHFCREIVDEIQLLAKKDQNIIYNHVGKNTEVFLDRNLLRNCIFNLMSNAIKYSGENTTIHLSTCIDADSFTITVEDNGIGIPKEEHKHLFEAFFRAQNTGNIPGTGLGLNIVLRYVTLMNGTINFKSATNEGTLFTITFPIQ